MAQKLLASLKKLDPEVRTIIEKFETLSDALIRLAYAEVPKSRGTDKFKIDPRLLAKLGKNLEDVPVVTRRLGIRRSYRDMVGIAGYEPLYSTVGGITAPKKIVCRGTNGMAFPQLIKGNH